VEVPTAANYAQVFLQILAGLAAIARTYFLLPVVGIKVMMKIGPFLFRQLQEAIWPMQFAHLGTLLYHRAMAMPILGSGPQLSVKVYG
jgi:hypothetical protein